MDNEIKIKAIKLRLAEYHKHLAEGDRAKDNDKSEKLFLAGLTLYIAGFIMGAGVIWRALA